MVSWFGQNVLQNVPKPSSVVRSAPAPAPVKVETINPTLKVAIAGIGLALMVVPESMVAPASGVAATAVAVAPLVLGPASSVPIATRAIASIVALAGMGYSIYTFTKQGGLVGKKDRPRLDKDIFISRKQMKELLRYRGKEIYKKLTRVHPDYQGTIWSDEDFHIDAGYRVRDRPNYKTWHLLVNKNAQSSSIRAIRDKVGDRKIFWDVFNMDNPPDYATWERKILKLFEQ